ncbi:MAG: phosphoadenosine phosphosulfate reductase family protein [Thermoprotei archaeon]
MGRVLCFVVDSATVGDLSGFLKGLWEGSRFRGGLSPIGVGHTVTTAWSLLSGRLPRWGGRPVGDWYYSLDEDGMIRGTHDMRSFPQSVVGVSGLREVWFNIPLMHPVPRVGGCVCVGGAPWFKAGYYTQPPWLEERLAEWGYTPDVADDTRLPVGVDELVGIAGKRGEALGRVLNMFEWDFAVAWFPELDRLHHTQLFPAGSPNDTPEARRRVMTAIDAACFNVARVAKADHVVVFSDHGWSDEFKYHWPNSFYLISQLDVEPPKSASVLDIIPTVWDLLGVSPSGVQVDGVSLLRKGGSEWNVGGGLAGKVGVSMGVVRRAVERWGDSLAVVWSGGKDSTSVLVMAHRVKPDVKVLFIDTYAHFRETMNYVRVIQRLLNISVYVLKRGEPIQDMAVDKKACCYANKVEPLHDGLEQLGVKAILTGIKRSDGVGREEAPIEEEKTTKSGYKYVQVNPILEWSEDDSLSFLELNGIPLNNLYYQGYRSIDCMPCTQRVLEADKPERWGRREKDKVVAQLRAMGYF